MDENRSMRFEDNVVVWTGPWGRKGVYLVGFENGHFQINKVLRTDQKLARIINASRKKEK